LQLLDDGNMGVLRFGSRGPKPAETSLRQRHCSVIMNGATLCCCFELRVGRPCALANIVAGFSVHHFDGSGLLNYIGAAQANSRCLLMQAGGFECSVYSSPHGCILSPVLGSGVNRGNRGRALRPKE
jgi:hypothetical protein